MKYHAHVILCLTLHHSLRSGGRAGLSFHLEKGLAPHRSVATGAGTVSGG